MNRCFLLLLICFFASWSDAQQNDNKKESDKKEQRITPSLHLDALDLMIQDRELYVQEEVSVEAPQYPGLDVTFESPANAIRGYKPYTKQELQAYSDLLLDYKLTDFDRTETARPHKQGRLLRVTVPE